MKPTVDIKILRKEFFAFIKSHGVLGVAIGIVMGQAVAKVVTVIVEGLVMPIIEVVLPGNKWQEAALHLGRVNIKLGLIISALLDFFAIAAVIFLIVKYILKVDNTKK